MENYRNKEAGKSSLVLAKAPAVIENHRDYCGKKEKLELILNKNKAIKRYVRSHMVKSAPHSSAFKMISLFN